MRTAAACILALATLACGFTAPAAAAPGETLAAEQTRLARDPGLTPLAHNPDDPGRYTTGPRDGWNLTLVVRGPVVTSELLSARTDPRAFAGRAFGAAVAGDLAASAAGARTQIDPDITQTQRRGARFNYRIVDDRRNGIHAIEANARPKARRTPAAAERTAVLALAATMLGSTPGALTVRTLTAVDLGHGAALAGTVNLRGTQQTPRVDHRLFFLAESNAGKWTLTLSRVQTIVVTEALLEETAEYFVDAYDLGGGSTGVVTRSVGFDAETYTMYVRSNAAWKAVYTGGGAAN